MEWHPDAKTKLKDIPFFVRPFAAKKIEKLAEEMGVDLITVEVYDAAKAKFNKKYNEMN